MKQYRRARLIVSYRLRYLRLPSLPHSAVNRVFHGPTVRESLLKKPEGDVIRCREKYPLVC